MGGNFWISCPKQAVSKVLACISQEGIIPGGRLADDKAIWRQIADEHGLKESSRKI
jgi:hypothetical protein